MASEQEFKKLKRFMYGKKKSGNKCIRPERKTSKAHFTLKIIVKTFKIVQLIQ